MTSIDRAERIPRRAAGLQSSFKLTTAIPQPQSPLSYALLPQAPYPIRLPSHRAQLPPSTPIWPQSTYSQLDKPQELCATPMARVLFTQTKERARPSPLFQFLINQLTTLTLGNASPSPLPSVPLLALCLSLAGPFPSHQPFLSSI